MKKRYLIPGLILIVLQLLGWSESGVVMPNIRENCDFSVKITTFIGSFLGLNFFIISGLVILLIGWSTYPKTSNKNKNKDMN